jgi:two-component system response regulator MprA
MKPDIMVIDDDEKIISLLRRSLTFEGYKVTAAKNGKEGLNELQLFTPDLIILDIMMPHMDGWEVCRRIRAAEIEVPILMLTAKDEVKERVKGLDLGADDYLVKPFALEELLARVRALLRRKPDTQEQSQHQLTYEDLMLDLDAREACRGDTKIELTTKEFELLHLLLRNPKRVLAREVIMEQIWGYDYSGESNVLEVYIAGLRQKTEENGGKRLIQTVRGAGYVLRGGN